MPEILITAMHNAGGPHIPSKHKVWLSDRDWPGGGTVKILNMQIGDCTLEVFPADRAAIEEFAADLSKLALKL